MGKLRDALFGGSHTDMVRKVDILQEMIKTQEKSISQYKKSVKTMYAQNSELNDTLVRKEEAIELMREAISAQRETINALQARGCK